MKHKPNTLGYSLQRVVERYEAGTLYFVYPKWAYEVAKVVLTIPELRPRMRSRIRTKNIVQ